MGTCSVFRARDPPFDRPCRSADGQTTDARFIGAYRMSDFPMQQNVTGGPKPGRWKRCAKLASFTTLVLIAVSAFVVKDYVRTLMSLRRVAGTNAYVMDYYLDYHIHEIRKHGIDVHNIEDSYLTTLLPDIVLPVAEHLKR